jgi:riboflavin kinase/FMN adenylyltransferase
MEILEGLDGLRRVPAGAVLSIGNFDGVHCGHGRILARAKELAAAHGSGRLAVVTFEPHPLTVLRPEMAPPRLTTHQRKEALICLAGASHLVILPPEPAVLNLTAEEFWCILRDEVRPALLVEGHSFYFGKNRGGSIEKLRQWTAKSQIRLEVIEAVEVVLTDLSVVTVSSSLIRWLLRHGRVRDAAICLGRAYELEGDVVRGHQRGRSIGVPTANLNCGDQIVPADGVYAGRCRIDNAIYPAAISIGSTPTFEQNTRQIEAHLVGFAGDLYGRTVRLELLDWIRDQVKFGSVELLKQQLRLDIDAVRQRCDLDPSRAIAAIEEHS